MPVGCSALWWIQTIFLERIWKENASSSGCWNPSLAIALLSLNARLPVVLSMFNESIAPHLQAANPALRILNPARIATPEFVGALDVPLRHEVRYTPRPPVERRAPARTDRLIFVLVTGFVLLLTAATAYFHLAEGLSWLDAVYFVVVTTATVGYGDISLLHSGTASKLVGIGLILASTVFIWMIFSLTVDRIIKRCCDVASACSSSSRMKTPKQSITCARLERMRIAARREHHVYCRSRACFERKRSIR